MKTIDYKLMGARIRTQRELLGYTREQLAEKLEVSSKFCSDIELGIKGMSMNTLAKLSDILCMSVDFILLVNKLTVLKLTRLLQCFVNALKSTVQTLLLL